MIGSGEAKLSFFSNREQQLRDTGLLVMRLGLGAMFVYHGLPKIAGGPKEWEKLGRAMEHVGVDFGHVFWGFAASGAEFFGGMALMLGLATRPAAFLMACTMIVAATMHLKSGDGLEGAAHAIEVGVVFLALAFTGGGRFSLDARLRR
jgi:putative oxidoreductase